MITWHHIAMFAQGVQFSDLGRRLRDGSGGLTIPNMVFILIVLVVAVGSLWLLSRFLKQRDGRGYNSPRKLFRELCKAHSLDRNDCRLLKRLARGHKLKQPSLLFLEPDRFDSGPVKSDLAPLRAEFQRIRDSIFGRRLDEMTSSGG